MAAAPIQLSSVLEYSLHIINGSVGCRTTGECNGSTPNHGLSESLSLTGKHDSYALTKSTGSVAQVWPYVEACLDGKVFDPSSLALEDLSTHARRGALKLKGRAHQLPVVEADSAAENWVQTLCLEYLNHVMMLAQAVLASQTPAPEHELIFDTFQGMVKTANQHPTSDSDFQAPDVIVKVKLQPGANDQPQGAQVEIFRAEIKAITTECLRSLLEWVVAEGVRFDPCNGLSRKGPIASIPADQHETLSRMVAQGKQYSEQSTSPGTCLLTNLYSYAYLFTRADRGVVPVSTNLLEQVASRRDPDKPFEPDIHDRGMESHQRIFETLLAVFLHGLCRARPELFLDPDLRSRLDQIAPELQVRSKGAATAPWKSFVAAYHNFTSHVAVRAKYMALQLLRKAGLFPSAIRQVAHYSVVENQGRRYGTSIPSVFFDKIFYGAQGQVAVSRKLGIAVKEGGKAITREIEMYKKLRGVEGVPEYLWTLSQGALDAPSAFAVTYTGETASTLEELAPHVKTIRRIIQTIHDRGVHHHDLVPRNITLDARGRVHIIDFGLAVWSSECLSNAEGDLSSPTNAPVCPDIEWVSRLENLANERHAISWPQDRVL